MTTVTMSKVAAGADDLSVWPASARRLPHGGLAVGGVCLAEIADLLAVPVAGAYQLSMASGYNMVGRPPVVAVHDGTARLLVRRETLADFRRRDIGE